MDCDFMQSTNIIAIKNFKVETNVQIIKLKKYEQYVFLPYDLNDYFLVNLDSIISLASMMHVAWSNSRELHHIDEKNLQNFSQI